MLHTLAAWTHDLSPFLVRFTESVGIRWYGLAYVLGFLIAWAWLAALARRRLILLKPEDIPDVILAQVIGVMVGGRLGYILLYDQSLLGFQSSFPWWKAINITTGGMASHGGIAGIILASLWCARHFKVPALHVLDAVASVAPAGVILGRLANFINAELLGKIVAAPGQPAPWWSVRYPTELIDRPTDAQLVRFAERFNVPPGQPLGPHLHDAIDRLRAGSQHVRAQLEPLLHARHPSQIYQALAEGLVTLLVVWFVWRKPRRPGVIAATFAISYALARIATDFVRLPDAQFAVGRPLGLTRGQWFSAATLILAIAVLAYAATRNTAPYLGGWHAHARAKPRHPAPTDADSSAADQPGPH